VYANAIRVEVFEAREEPGVELAEALADLAGSLTGTPRLREAAEEAIPDILENAPDDERAREVLPELLGDYRTGVARLDLPDMRLAYAEAALRRLTEPPVTTAG